MARNHNSGGCRFALDCAAQLAHFFAPDFARLNRNDDGQNFIFRFARVGNSVNAFVRTLLFIDNDSVVRISENRPIFQTLCERGRPFYESARQLIPYPAKCRAVQFHRFNHQR